MVEFLRFLVYVLAVYRVAELVVFEDGPYRIMDRIRKGIGKRAAGSDDEKWDKWRNLAELINCPYCMGIWAALILLPLVAWPYFGTDLFLVWLGGAGGQSWMERKSNDD